jgi:Ca2+-binding RTX toxin-like protein
MSSRGKLRQLVAGVAVTSTLLLTMLILVPMAHAVIACDRTGGNVDINFGQAGETVVVVRAGNNINVNGSQCDDATVSNTNNIANSGVTNGNDTFTIDLSGGPFTADFDLDLGTGNGDSLTIVGSSIVDPLDPFAADDSIAVFDGAVRRVDADLNATDAASVDGVETVRANTGTGDDTVDGSGLTLAVPTVAFSVDGGAGDDWILGSEGGDTLNGGDGSDTIDVSASGVGATVNLQGTQTSTGADIGSDALSNFENIWGSLFADTLTGDQNDNWITPSDGNDVVNGGAGNDTVDYEDAGSGVTVDLSVTAAQATGGSGSDTLSNFENVNGSDNNDTLTGDLNDNVLGVGTGGNDAVNGAAGFDIVDYSWVTPTINLHVDLSVATVQDVNSGGGTKNDTLTNLEGAWGGDGNDTFLGTSGDNEFDGGAGSDRIDYSNSGTAVNIDLTGEAASGAGSDSLFGFENATGSGFDDTIEGTYGATAAEANNALDGGLGNDTVSFSQAAAGVSASLGAGTAGGGAGTDTIANFEGVIGSAFNDTLAGSAGNNTFDGGAGDDSIDGGLGTDTSDYSGSAVAIDANLLVGTVVGDGTDTVASIENVNGSAFDDTFAGDDGNNRFDGGAGVDTISYQLSGSPVIIDLATGVATGQGTDLLFNFENAKGSSLNDTINGNDLANRLQGTTGNDTINGKGGDDHVGGSDGNDTLRGSGGNDNIKGGNGDDFLAGGSGNDTCNPGPGKDTVKSCE